MTIVLAELLLAPLCVVAVSLAGRKWGVAVAGFLGGLPVVAGPILLVLTPVHGPSVVALTAASGALGPSLSGLLAPFPVIASVLAVFTHAHDGLGQVRVLLRSLLVGLYGFAAFCFALALSLDSLGGLAAFSAALVAALAVQAAIFALNARRLRPQTAEG